MPFASCDGESHSGRGDTAEARKCWEGACCADDRQIEDMTKQWTRREKMKRKRAEARRVRLTVGTTVNTDTIFYKYTCDSILRIFN